MPKGNLVIAVPILRKHMIDMDVALTTEKAAEILDVSKGSAYNIFTYMKGVGIVKSLRRGRETYYVLSEVFDGGRLETVLGKSGAPPLLRILYRPRRRAVTPRIRERVVSPSEEQIASIRKRAESGEGISSLSVIGLSDTEVNDNFREMTGSDESIASISTIDITDHDDTSVGLSLEELRTRASEKVPIIVLLHGKVSDISKDTTLISLRDARHLMNYLSCFNGFEDLRGFTCFYVSKSALNRGEYGNIFYVSRGPGFYEDVYKVYLVRSIFRYQPLLRTERLRWYNWTLAEKLFFSPPRYSKSEYEKILDAFIDSGSDLVEITVKNRNARYVINRIKEIIEQRELGKEISISGVDEWIYLENIKNNNL